MAQLARRRLVPWGALALAACTLIGFAIASPGFATTEVKLHDSGIWVTNNQSDLYGRMNLTAASLDAYLTPGAVRSGDLDMFQDGASVVARDVANGQLIPIDPVVVANKSQDVISLPTGAVVAMNAGTMAVLDVNTGQLRAIRYSADQIPPLAGLDVAATAIATLGDAPSGVPVDSSAALAVGVDGTIYAVSASGEQISVAQNPRGGFAEPVTMQTDAALSGAAVTAVGGQLVVLDTVTGVIHLPDNQLVQLPGALGAVLQQPGPASAFVYAATTTALFAVPLAGGQPISVFVAGQGSPARPVVVAGNVYGAWSGSPGQAVGGPADGFTQMSPLGLDRDKVLIKPVFRVNHDRVVLNDMATGTVFDVISKRSLDNWADVQKPADDSADQQKRQQQLSDSAPTARDDNLGARPGRTTLLYVLDNDTDPGGSILAVKSVTNPSGEASAQISEDGQTVMLTTPTGASGQISFSYTVSNGTGEASANVTVTIKSDDENGEPYLRDGYMPITYPVAASGTVGLFVVQDWRDPDGDPISVVSAAVGDNPVPISPQGKIYYTAGRSNEATDQVINYMVSDGRSDTTVAGKSTVHVLATGDTTGAPPVAQADMVRGVAGMPVTFSPLANDIPGADPRNPAARLMLAGNVNSLSLVHVTTDLSAGTVTAIADQPGTYTLDYTAAFGATQVSASLIRLEIAAQGNQAPVTAPDQVTVRGQVAATVDVLANDSDPTNSVLTVTDVQAADPDQLSVAVFDGRWLRIQPLTATLSPNPMVVRYTATNGMSDPVPGDVIVTQVAAPTTDALLLADDSAVVRCGDSALIDVLANDASASGKTLLLDEQPDPTLPSGELPVVVIGSSAGSADNVDAGHAYAVGNKVRYVAPVSVDVPMRVAVTYAAATADGGTPQSATLTIEVRPEPSDDSPDAAPIPGLVESRAVSGDTVAINIPIYGVDPDGDSVTVTGIASAPTKGRVIAFSPTSVTYQAFPTDGNNGTDSFTYVVADRYGRTGIGTVRVGLAPPSLFPPSVAIDDTVTAQPGASVSVQPMANDLLAIGDAPTIVPVGDLPDGVSLSDDGLSFQLTAPAAQTDAPVQFLYLLSGTGGDSRAANITVKARNGFLNPPKAHDTVAVIGPDGTASADPLATAWDIDGPKSAIKLTAVDAGVIAVDGKVIAIPVTDRIQAISYVIQDGDGAQSSAIIFVPQAGAGAPELKPGVAAIQMDANSSQTFNLADYVFSPRDRPVRITQADLVTTAPVPGLAASPDSPTALTLTSSANYFGPAAISLQVADGDSSDPTTLQAFVSIPVQIGPPTPVLRCPTAAQTVVQGGSAKVLDITALCHVWMPDSATAVYTATWPTQMTGVSATGGNKVTVTASGSATAPSTGQLMIGIENSQATPQPLNIAVISAPKAKVSVTNLVDIKAGSAATQRVAISSPLRDAQPTIISVHQVNGDPVTIGSPVGMSFTLTPDANSHGVMTFQLVASDLADPTRTERYVTLAFTMTVYTRPDAPTPPQPGSQLVTHVVPLTWTPGADNGAAIDQYQVQSSDGRFTTNCGKMTRCDIAGVPDGTPISFVVRAHNKADWSDWSEPGPLFTPNDVPGMVTDFRATNPQDGKLTLTWGPAPVDGSPVMTYHISWAGGTTGSVDVSGDTLSQTISGLDNNQTTQFSIVAENAAGLSPVTASTSGQSSGKPRGLGAPRVSPQDLGDTAQVSITWGAATPNGPGPVTYLLTRSGGGDPLTFAPTTSTSLADQVSYDGTLYTYSVVAVNASGGPDHTSDAQMTTWKATGSPADWAAGAVTMAATGTNGQMTVNFTYPTSHGETAEVQASWSGAGSGSQIITGLSPRGGSSQFQISGLTNGFPVTVLLVLCNETNCQGANKAATASGSSFGPLVAPVFNTSFGSLTDTGQRQLCATFSGKGNGRDAQMRITADGSVIGDNPGTTSTVSTTLDTNVTYCTIAAGTGLQVTFHATIISGSTSPARSNSTTTDHTLAYNYDPILSYPTVVATSPPPNTQSLDKQVCATFAGSGAGLPARLHINASGPIASPNNGFVTDATVGTTGNMTYCIIASKASAFITFTAYMENADPTSTRSNSGTVSQIVAAADDPSLDPPAVVETSAGAPGSGERQVCATFSGSGNGLLAHVRITASGSMTNLGPQAASTPDAATSSTHLCVVTTNQNVPILFTAVMVDDSGSPRGDSGPTTVSVTSASDPTLAQPVLMGTTYGDPGSDDRRVCATFSGNGNGLDAQLQIKATGTIASTVTEATSAVVTGATGSVELCVDTQSANTQVTFTAIMVNKSNSTRADSPAKQTMVVSASGPPPPSPTVTVQAVPSTALCEDGTVCHPVQVTTKNFGPSSVQCSVTQSSPARSDLITWTQGGYSTLNIPNSTGGYAMWPEDGSSVTVVCGGVSSGKVILFP